jgi:hypothetical protein
MYKDSASLRDRGVVVDKEGKVGYGFMATVGRYAKVFDSGIGRRIDLVDAEVILGREAFQPHGVAVSSDVRDYQRGLGAIFKSRTQASSFREPFCSCSVSDRVP